MKHGAESVFGRIWPVESRRDDDVYRLAGSHLTPREFTSLAEIGGIVSSSDEASAAGQEVLKVLRKVIPYAAASISVWSPLTDRHLTIANAGYPTHVVEHLDSWFVHHDAVYEWMRDVNPRPLRWKDMPFDYRHMYSAQEVFIPVGFDEGVTTCLYTPSGRYTGNLHVSSDTTDHPSLAAMDALTALQSMLSGLADALRSVGHLVQDAGPDAEVGMVTEAGRLIALPDRPPHRHLREGPLVDLVVDLVRTKVASTRFLWEEKEGSWHRVVFQPLNGGAFIALRPLPHLPYGLTARELDVLTLIAEGRTNPEIATALTVTPKTVAKHVEHLLQKTGWRSRSAAAAHAVGEGLGVLPVGGARFPLTDWDGWTRDP